MYTSEKTAVAKPRVLSLYHLVAELLDSYGRVNKERRSCFVNEVPATMVVNSQLIAPILGDLFAIISALLYQPLKKLAITRTPISNPKGRPTSSW